jgi:hypothetical protein
MDNYRKNWNSRQRELRILLSSPQDHSRAIPVFLQQHAEVHTKTLSSFGDISFADRLLDGLSEQQLRQLPPRMEHSIVWILWHLARIEDVTMSLLVAGRQQLFAKESWKSRVGISVEHTGNAMTREEVMVLSQKIHLDTLMEYRLAVGRQTQSIVKQLDQHELGQKVAHSRIESVINAGDVRKEAQGIINYWSKRTIAGLLLMPPTRHCFIHLNEATRIKQRV